MYLTLIALPLIGGIISGLLGRKIGKEGSQIITCTGIIISCILAITAYYEVGFNGSSVNMIAIKWFESETISINWGIQIDSLTVSMLLAVLIVSVSVHTYSIEYMREDPHSQRFFSYLSLFTFFMLILVTGDNLILIFIGWEGVGVCSYLLISFWYRRIEANKASIKAFIMNRIGDWGFSIGLYILYSVYGNWDYSTIFALTPIINENLIAIISICLLIAGMGKSAQLPLQTWLADAMEGPTPVSALIHAATMVTAGVYLLLRASPLLEYSSTGLMIITIVGGLTAFFGATTALVQNDIKRLIAYSTCSQLGYLFIAVGCSNYSTSIFHLVNHAFFKALLFLSAGGVLHALNDEQDMRKMGGLVNLLPFTYTNILIGSLSLMALPFLTGYYSKDIIIETAFGQFIFMGTLAYWLGTITAILTAAYSFRIIYLTFLSEPKGPRINYESPLHENLFFFTYPLIPLAFASIIFGYLFKDLFIGLGTSFWANSLFVHPNNMSFVESEFHNISIIKLAPLIGSIFGAIFAYMLPGPKAYQLIPSIIRFNIFRPFNMLHNRYWFDNIYNGLFLYPVLYSGYISSKILDRGIIEYLGPYGISNSFYSYSKILSRFDTGYIPYYALIFIISLISLIWISDIKLLLLFFFLLVLL